MAKKVKEKESAVSNVNELFRRDLASIALELGKDPSEVTKVDFAVHSSGNIKEWDLRKAGGFAALKKMFFPVPTEGAQYRTGAKIISAFRNKLEKQFATQAFMQDEILKVLNDVLSKNPITMHKPVKRFKSKKSDKKDRTILAHLSDTHYGADIDSKELGGINKYDWTIAARRTAMFVDQIAQYKPQYRDSTNLVLAVNGDLIAGVIHDTEWHAQLLSVQFAGTIDIMVQAISYLATKFKTVQVEWTIGNHDRAQHKQNKGRATTHKWDSYGMMIGLAVKRILEATHTNVKLNAPMTPYSIVEIHGHLFFITHGDTVFSVGNPGRALNMGRLNTQIANLNASELGGGGRKFAGVLVGHVHTPTVQLTESGCMLLINGCLSGLDGFAQSIGIFSNTPTQQLVEVTKEHAVGDIRMIQVKEADTQSSLDTIIKPFKGHLG